MFFCLLVSRFYLYIIVIFNEIHQTNYIDINTFGRPDMAVQRPGKCRGKLLKAGSTGPVIGSGSLY